MPAELKATMTMQRTGRKWLAKLRVAHMRREREKRRQRLHQERLKNQEEIVDALKLAEEKAASRAQRAKLSYMQEQKQDDANVAEDLDIKDWKQMRDMHGNVFYFSPSTGKTTKVEPPNYIPMKSGPTAMEMLTLNEDDVDENGEDALGWKMHDHSRHAMELIKQLDTTDWMQHDWVKPSVALVSSCECTCW